MPRMRTFIAVPLEPVLRQRAVKLQEALAPCGGDIKWVEPENLHVTLLFLGEVDVRDTLEVCRTVSSVAAPVPPFAIRVAGVGCFPNLRRPRTIWAGIEDGAAELVQIHDAIEKALLSQGGYRREDRSFTPHITLGRVKGEEDSRPLAEALVKYADWNAGSEIVREIHVLSSELTSAGPRYTRLGRGKLTGAPNE